MIPDGPRNGPWSQVAPGPFEAVGVQGHLSLVNVSKGIGHRPPMANKC